MMSEQNAIEYVKDQMQQGKMNASQANVCLVQMIGVKLVSNKIPKDVRKALNDAVKNGELGHIKKDGLYLEAYHHKNARGKALDKIREDYRTKYLVKRNIFA